MEWLIAITGLPYEVMILILLAVAGAFAGFVDSIVGGGGLGDIAIRYGYQRFQGDIMLATIIILIIMVQVIQMIGDGLSKAMNKK